LLDQLAGDARWWKLKIFVSSTFEDLRDYREAAIKALRQMGHEVVAMEDFTASSAPPVERVLELVRACQAYIGIFAWRYGYIPRPLDIPAGSALPAEFEAGKTSVTHLEYLEAKAQDREILAFLVDETVPWPPHKIDAFVDAGEPRAGVEGACGAPGSSIQALRQSLKRERIVSFFSSPSDLEARVATAVTNLGLTLQIATNLYSLTQPVPPVPDSSAHGPIRVEVMNAQTTLQRTVTVDLLHGWWLTRLYLLAELVSRFTDIRRIVLIKGDSKFIGMLSVRTVLERLAIVDARLGAFSSELDSELKPVQDQDSALDRALELWDQKVEDTQQHVLVTAPNLTLWFGDTLFRHPVQVQDLSKATLLDIVQVLSYPNDFVPVSTRPGAMEEIRKVTNQPPETGSPILPIAVIDKRTLNDQLARRYVDELMERARLK
jgi:hypothetical protein